MVSGASSASGPGAGAPGGTALRSVADLAPGDVLDKKYRLTERIGRGGFGDVWRAVELLPGGGALRDVALKVLAQAAFDSTWAEEAKLLASFSHPSLVTIYAAGILTDLEAPFVAMELLIGETLADKLRRRGPLPWRAVLRYACDVASALDVIHERGVVHLDLKPANIFVTQKGAVKVLDFGISRSAHGAIPRERAMAASADPALVATAMLSAAAPRSAAAALDSSDPFAATQIASHGQASDRGRVVVGTPGFVAPEVLEYAEPTRLADAYALGVTIAQLVIGALPHNVSVEPPDDSDADTLRAYFVELREATLSGRMLDLTDKGAPRGVAALVQRLCATAPKERAGPSLRALLDEAWTRPHGAPKSPYPGAEPYPAELEGFLFGRDAELARILRHLSFESVVAVAGAFGAGKTSFVRAALVPEIAKTRVDGRIDFRVASVVLGDDPDAALDRALASIGAERFDEEGEDEGDVARLAGLVIGDDVGVVIVIDDLERLIAAPPEARARTVSFVGDALAARKVEGLRIVLVVDQEDVDELPALDPSLAPLPGVVRYLAPPPEAAARDIATAPARALGWSIQESGAIEAAIEAEIAAGSSLPIAAVALAAWAKPEKRTLSAAGPTAVTAALHRHASTVFGSFDGQAREVAIEVLLQLASSDGAPLTRTVEDLTRLAGEDVERTTAVIAGLRRGHLVILHRGSLRLSHAALSSWPELQSARLSAMDRLALRERLIDAREVWERNGRRAEHLDRGALADELARGGAAALRGLSAQEREFLALSKRARRRALAWRFAALLVAVVGVVSVVVGKRALDRRRLAAEDAEKDAVRRAAVTELVSRARGTTDPYERVAYLAQAVRLGAADHALPMELLAAAYELAPARFLTLDAVDEPAMPWNSRWVVGIGAAGTFVAIDLEPKESEPEVLEHVDMDMDSGRLELLYRRPVVHALGVGSAPVVDVVPFGFDTAVLARNAAGQVELFRLRESGEVALAARVPMTCKGGLVAAARAPVAACISGSGIAVWDARTSKHVALDEPAGALALSPDGTRLAAWTGADVALLAPFDERAPRGVIHAPGRVRLAAFGPREPLIAIALDARLIVVASDEPDRTVFDTAAIEEPAAIRWDDRGLDVTLCRLSGAAVHYYLRTGARSPDDPKPTGGCEGLRPEAPRLKSRLTLGDFASRSTGAHFSRAFELDQGRLLSTTLALAVTGDDRLDRKLLFVPRDEELRPLDPRGGPSIARLVRHEGVAIVERSRKEQAIERQELPELVVVEAGTGRRLQGARGHLLSSCEGGKIAAFRPEADRWVVFEVRSGGVLGVAKREPGIVVGLAPSCEKLYTQRLDGTIQVSDLRGETIGAARVVATASGFVFDAKPSAAFPGGAAGLLVALSSGEVARISEDDDALRRLARAMPRATALGDGATAGETLFADSVGLWRIGRDGAVERIVASPSGAAWEDVLPVRGGAALLVASVEELAVVDVEAHAMVASAPIRGRTRLLPWDTGGSALAYAPDVEGIDSGVIVPYGSDAVSAIAALSSNLRASPTGSLELKR